MQHTDKYKFNLIETSDTFSPEALNANTKAVEAQLAALESAAAADKAELKAAAAADKAELKAAAAADKAELKATAAADKAELKAADTALKTAIGSGGGTARFTFGTYTGDGATTRVLTVPFRPMLLILHGSGGIAVLPRGIQAAPIIAFNKTVSIITWGEDRITINRSSGEDFNANGYNYTYFVIGESL